MPLSQEQKKIKQQRGLSVVLGRWFRSMDQHLKRVRLYGCAMSEIGGKWPKQRTWLAVGVLKLLKPVDKTFATK